jgi:hypothetical protein
MGQWHSVAALQVLLSETRREYIPVDSSANVLFAMVSESSTCIPAWECESY